MGDRQGREEEWVMEEGGSEGGMGDVIGREGRQRKEGMSMASMMGEGRRRQVEEREGCKNGREREGGREERGMGERGRGDKSRRGGGQRKKWKEEWKR